jgi:hypothetical protein
MILTQAHDHEVRYPVFPIHLLELLDKLLAPPEIAHSRLLVGQIILSEGLAQDSGQTAASV